MNLVTLHGGRGAQKMAQLNLTPPKPFDFQHPEEWPKWKKNFERYRTASRLDDESEGRQISTLLYCLGEDSEEILRSTTTGDEGDREPDTYNAVIEKFESFFQVRKNVIFERARLEPSVRGNRMQNNTL